jgi:ankyrin repeat protein
MKQFKYTIMTSFEKSEIWDMVLYDSANQMYEYLDNCDFDELPKTEVMHPKLKVTALQWTVMHGETSKVNVLICNACANRNVRDRDQETLLHIAVRYNRPKIMALLFNLMVDPSPKGDGGQTPLTVAARGTNVQIVKMLIKNNADVNSIESSGMTALHWAVRGGDMEIVRMLIDAGANILAVDGYGLTVVDMATRTGNIELAMMLKAEIGRRAR